MDSTPTPPSGGAGGDAELDTSSIHRSATGDKEFVLPLGITVGRGLSRPKGRFVPIHLWSPSALARAIENFAGEEAWWSPHVFKAGLTPATDSEGRRGLTGMVQRPDHYRHESLWVAAAALGVDMDFHDREASTPAGRDSTKMPPLGWHVALPPDVVVRLLDAIKACKFSGCIAHLTPRGLRVIFLLAVACTDAAAFDAAIAVCGKRLLAELGALGLAHDGKRGLCFDENATDRARLLYTPNSTVNGTKRSAQVYVMREKPYSLADFAPIDVSTPAEESTVNEESDAVALPPPPLDALARELNVGIKVDVVCMADVQPEAVDWLWPKRLAIGKLQLFAGDGGRGKSTLTLDIASRVSRGAPWPDGSGNAQLGSVLILSAEDDPGDTIRPRLDAACADVTKVHVLTGVSVTDSKGSQRSYCLTLHDLAAIEKALDDLPDVRLLIVDPIAAYLGKTDSHVDAEIRGLLAPLAALAAKKRIAVVIVAHLNKGSTVKAIYRISGSQGTYNAARLAWFVTDDEQDEDKRLMLPAKNNLAKSPGGLAFRLRSAESGVAHVEWIQGRVDVDLDEALAGPRDNERMSREDAQGFLLAELADGPVKADEIKRRARKAGVGWRTVEKAKKDLGVESKRVVDGDGAAWWWMLPGAGAKTADNTPTTAIRPYGLADKPPPGSGESKTATPHADRAEGSADLNHDAIGDQVDRWLEDNE